MPQAVFNSVVIADAEETVIVDGNHYFPRESLKIEYFSETPVYTTTCAWKGVASYFDVEVAGERARAVAWTYRDPSEKAAHIKDHVAFYPKVLVEGVSGRGIVNRG